MIYCIIYAAVNTLMVDKTHTQNIRTAVIIITKEDPEKLKHYIMDELARGVTHWDATAGLHGRSVAYPFHSHVQA